MIPFLEAATNLVAALMVGAVIGFERQWRQRLAGLRTNTLAPWGRPCSSCSPACSRARPYLRATSPCQLTAGHRRLGSCPLAAGAGKSSHPPFSLHSSHMPPRLGRGAP
ncbi:hypothetical protein DUT91_23500 [Phyllobacterium salinisoli]|uniref:MgtC/SapB/SrpB/YhiD N-terminal domain-containing protein n=2 Tax=Phyllobacterium salinisoli TaxID=1899321 RepID=A0A368JWK6_9HYPH|nr:hypothetical protein DUT91_23500 [Phyllobacterium salinisoli]